MKKIVDMSRTDLEQLTLSIQKALYLDYDQVSFNFNKEWSFDTLHEIAQILAAHDLIPTERVTS